MRTISAGVLFACALLALPATTALAEDNTYSLFTGWTNPVAWDNGLNVLGDHGTNNHIEVRGTLFECLMDFALGYYGDNNSLTITEGGWWWPWRDVWIGYGSSLNSLTILNGHYESKYQTLGEFAGDRYNTTVVTGTNSFMRCDWIKVGAAGSDNSLTISLGGRVGGEGHIGSDPSAHDNSVSVDGSGSRWTNVSLMVVGHSGYANSLSITDGGLVDGSGYSYIGRHYDGSNNTVLVTGSGSAWNNWDLTIGESGDANSLTIAEGGRVITDDGFIGYYGSANNNTAFVTGAGSVWSNLLLIVGYSGVANSLSITNGGRVASAHGFVGGNDINARNNRAWVTGTGSAWNNSDSLHVGSYGSGNSLTIAAGGLVATTVGFVGGNDTNADNNTGLVTGPGSVWTNAADLEIGESGSDNGLAVGDGGRVYSQNGIIGSNETARNNSAVVTGNGSIWRNSGSLMVGSAGSGNGLTISDSGQTIDANATIGSSGSSSNNAVFVIGPGSIWSSSGTLAVGASGSGNSLTVTDSARVVSSAAYIGSNSDAHDNTAAVDGSGSVWSNSGSLWIGDLGSGNSLFVPNGGRVASDGIYVGYSGAGNRLTIASDGRVTDNFSYIGYTGTASNNAALVDGSGSAWNNGSFLHVGYSGTGNRLTITNSGRVGNTYGYIGDNSGADDNAVLVTGAGSIWSNSFNVYVGIAGDGNRLTISNDARVANTYGYIGDNSSASGNEAVVTGSGSVWSNSLDATIGNSGSGNRLTVTNGGQIFDVNGRMGFTATASNNTAVVDGSGSVWKNSSDLYVGQSGAGNDLTIARSGQVASYYGYIGYNSNANNNAALVTDPGSIWTNSTDFYVGYSGSGNGLTIANGGRVVNWVGYVGRNSSAGNNAVLVTGAGSGWSNVFINGIGGGDLYVGHSGAGNSLTIANGGRVANLYGRIGFSVGASSNWVYVTGSGSVWNNGNPLYVGDSGAGNGLTIAGGGRVASISYGYIGNTGSASNNTALVTGAGSVWSNNNGLYIGNSGSGNRLTVTNGGQVLDSGGTLGYLAGANNNSARVDGADSMWNNSGYVTVGDYGADNSLTIVNSGRVANTQGRIGDKNGASNNTVWVTGSGSIWSNSGFLAVGEYGARNSLTIANGGCVASSLSYIGDFSSARNNAMLVTGLGSVWNSSGALHVGVYSAGNRLTVTNGGQVLNTSSGYIGSMAGASNNTALVTGSGSVWSNRLDLYVGLDGASNRLTIANGGRVANAHGTLGNASRANTVLVTGPGAIWTNSGVLNVGLYGAGNSNSLIVTNGGQVNANSLYVGYYGAGNSLAIVDSGRVFNAIGGIGIAGSASNNTVFVTGSGSVWSNNSVDLRVGDAGAGNRLTVTNGGRVVNSGGLYVGYSGVGNGLTIANSGRVANTFGYIGYQSGASNNTVLVTGPGSIWSNSADLRVGAYYGSSNRLTIAHGGTVMAGGDMVVGYAATSTNNHVRVAGGNLNVAGSLTVRGGTLELSNGWIAASSLLITNCTLAGVGGISDPVTVQASGRISPGNSPGTLAFGNLTLHSGALITSEMASLSLYDQIVATNLTVNGTVAWNATLIGNVTPSSTPLKLIDVGSYLGATTNNWLSLGGTHLLVEGELFTLVGTDGSNYTFQISYAGNGMVGGNGNDVVLTAFGSGDVPGIDFQAWLAVYNLATNGSDDLIDSDLDGMNNWLEYGAGTDPKESNSVLQVTTIVANGGGVRVGWTGGIPVWQFLETRPNSGVTESVWRAIWTNPPPPQVATNFLDSISVSNRFYRVRTQRN